MQSGDPVWTEKVEESEIVQDPLAIKRVTNRLLGDLLPGITTITPRARYIAHHAWAIWDIEQREDPETRIRISRSTTSERISENKPIEKEVQRLFSELDRHSDEIYCSLSGRCLAESIRSSSWDGWPSNVNQQFHNGV